MGNETHSHFIMDNEPKIEFIEIGNRIQVAVVIGEFTHESYDVAKDAAKDFARTYLRTKGYTKL